MFLFLRKYIILGFGIILENPENPLKSMERKTEKLMSRGLNLFVYG